MTTRSQTSFASSKEPLTDGDVYVFVLQVALLHHINQTRPEASRPGLGSSRDSYASAGSGGGGAAVGGTSPSKAATSSSASTSTGNGGSSRSEWGFAAIADMLIKSGSVRDARFPEKLIKRLNERLQNVAMGKDPMFRDQSLRSTIGVFYGQYQDPTFQKQLRDSRKVEDLILHFATAAQASLRKRATGDEWKEELEIQVGQFIRIVREALKLVSGVPKELSERLDAYSAKLTPKPISLGANANGGNSKRVPAPTTLAAPGSTSGASSDAGRRDSGASQLSLGDPVGESALIKAVGKLFHVQEGQLRMDVDSLKATCTDKAAVLDLKQCTANINLGTGWPGNRSDFDSESTWQAWKSSEQTALSALIATLCKNNPELMKTASSSIDGVNGIKGSNAADTGSIGRSSQAGTAAAASSEPSEAGDESFTYIPPDPTRTYKRALEICMEYDLEEIRNQEDAEEVSLSILSPTHVELLKECAQWWRVSTPYRAIANFDVIRLKFEAGEAPLDCLSVAVAAVESALQEAPVETWMTQDRDYLLRIYSAAFEGVMRGLYEAFQDVRAADPDEVQNFATLLEELHASGFVRQEKSFNLGPVDLDQQLEDIKDSIRIHAIHEYTAKTTELFSQHLDNEIVPLVHLVEWLEKGAKHLDRAYPNPILNSVDPVSLVLEKQVPLFFDDLDSMQRQVLEHALRDAQALSFDDIFTLYHRVMALRRMFKAFCPHVKQSFEIASWFEPHVQHWLLNTGKKTSEWVENAVRSDPFLPIESTDAYHSSSIDDLFGALQQPLEFIQSLKWPDKYMQARFLTTLSRIFSNAIEKYCNRVEEMFMEELFPRNADVPETAPKQSAWMVKAKQTLQGEKKVEPFHFQSQSCVKLNNIEAARVLLDKLYAKIDADTQADILQEAGAPPPPDANKKRRYIFTVKIVLGEGLQPINSNASSRIDSFVTLSDERGNRIAKTRTIYETPDPRWDEVFDIPVDQSMWLAATVWDRKLVGDHALCGRAYLRLDPKYFGDLHAHELWLPLDTQGKLLLRVSMEGERDDILFHFGKAFRSLKRAEGDMVRIIVDKMSIFIRHCLSRQVLRSLVRTSGINLDKAIVNVKALYATALASTSANASMIPPVESEATRNRSKTQQLTDAEIEAAITPLFDYLDECLATLKSSLSESEALLVLTKVWKEVLNTIESILLPPLSDAPADMQQLSEKEVDIVFKWLSFLRNYFNAYDEETGVAGGVPLETLQNYKYREILQYLLWQDATTDALMEECARTMQQVLRKQAGGQLSKSKSVYNQRSLGTIKKRKQDKKKQEEAPTNEILIMKLLRMRPGTQEFLSAQLGLKAQLSAMANVQEHRNLRDGGGRRRKDVPPLPSK